ncbi:MAG: thermonuclease family protein [Ignavibacteria bacterium]|nr:thermonuclease family protein [Ignavibacteria bacterium]
MTSKRISILLFILLFLFTGNVLSQEQFIIGEFAVSKILDGDTFRFDGLDKSTRLLGIDTEETFKDENAEMKVNDIASRWLEYYAQKKDSSNKPAKIESPFGYDTWQWTKKMFKDVVKVRLEVDDFKRVIDMFNRYLVYIIAIKEDGTEFNYNIECVKQGYSPYFSKYGYSARFHDAFVKAQNYARDNKLGIWSGKELCYPDYPERLEWWDKRGEQIKKFETMHMGKEGYYSMLDISDYNKLKAHMGDTVTIFGNISRVITDNDPRIVKFEINDDDTIDLVFFKRNYAVLDELKLNEPKGYYVYAKGKLSEYKGKLQIIVDDKSQVWEE